MRQSAINKILTIRMLWSRRRLFRYFIVAIGLLCLYYAVVLVLTQRCTVTPLQRHPVDFQVDLHQLESLLSDTREDRKNGYIVNAAQVAIIVRVSGKDLRGSQVRSIELSWGRDAVELGLPVLFVNDQSSRLLGVSTTSELAKDIRAIPSIWLAWSNALRRLPEAEFLVMVNETTYLRPDVLLDFVRRVPIGTNSSFGNKIFGFLDVGAGQIFTSASVRAMLRNQEQGRCSQTVLDDLTVSRCAEAAGTKLVSHPMMHRYPPHEFWGCAVPAVFRLYLGTRWYEVADLQDMWMTFNYIEGGHMVQIHNFLRKYGNRGSDCLIGGLSALSICTVYGYIEDETIFIKWLVLRAVAILSILLGAVRLWRMRTSKSRAVSSISYSAIGAGLNDEEAPLVPLKVE